MPLLRLLSVTTRSIPDTDDLVSLVSGLEPDLLAVHGAPHLVRWRQAVGAIARRTGLVVVSGGGRRAGASLILSSLGVDAFRTRDLPFTGAGGLHPPGATLAQLSWRGTPFVFAATTLIGNSAARLGQARELSAAVATLTPAMLPSIVSAEGTDRPGTAAYQELAQSRVAKTQRVFVDERFTVTDAQTLDGHPFTAPVLLELQLD